MRKLKGKLCYLCGNAIMAAAEGDRDHIPPRNIFPTDVSGNLITVPTHKSCNNGLSIFDETFRAFILGGCYDNARAKELQQTVVKKSHTGPIGQRKRDYLLSKVRDEVFTDDGELIKGPLLLIEADNPSFMPQFERIIKGLYYHKLRSPLSPNISLKTSFKDISELNEIGFNPKWEEVEKDVFRYFLCTQHGDYTNGVVGLLFYEKLFCVGFFSEQE